MQLELVLCERSDQSHARAIDETVNMPWHHKRRGSLRGSHGRGDNRVPEMEKQRGS